MKAANERWLVSITFKDHVTTCGGISKSIECTAYGVLISEDKDHYYVATWIADHEIDGNTDTHTILKKVVISVKRLSRIKL